MNHEHQLKFTSVLLAQMTSVIVGIAVFAFLESQRTMDLVLRHLTEFPLPSHELHVNNQRFLLTVVLVIGVTAATSILFGIWASHKLAGPVLKMTRVLEAAAGGQFSARVSFRKEDHLEDLAASMNQMLGALAAEQMRRRQDIAEIEEMLARLAETRETDPDDVHAVRARIARLAGVEIEAPVTTVCG